MTIEVTQREDGSFDISWDENDPTESVFNDWTESDFQNLISDYLKELKENGIDGEGEDLS
jgi:hypothetical protein